MEIVTTRRFLSHDNDNEFVSKVSDCGGNESL